MGKFWLINGCREWPQWVVLCRLCPRIVLVISDANDWSGRMQMGGQVRAITQLRSAKRKASGFHHERVE